MQILMWQTGPTDNTGVNQARQFSPFMTADAARVQSHYLLDSDLLQLLHVNRKALAVLTRQEGVGLIVTNNLSLYGIPRYGPIQSHRDV